MKQLQCHCRWNVYTSIFWDFSLIRTLHKFFLLALIAAVNSMIRKQECNHIMTKNFHLFPHRTVGEVAFAVWHKVATCLETGAGFFRVHQNLIPGNLHRQSQEFTEYLQTLATMLLQPIHLCYLRPFLPNNKNFLGIMALSMGCNRRRAEVIARLPCPNRLCVAVFVPWLPGMQVGKPRCHGY